MRTLGKALQVSGPVLLPVAVLMEVLGLLGRTGGVSQLLTLMVAGVALFGLGRVIEGYAR
jgi:hypothetical protein